MHRPAADARGADGHHVAGRWDARGAPAAVHRQGVAPALGACPERPGAKAIHCVCLLCAPPRVDRAATIQQIQHPSPLVRSWSVVANWSRIEVRTVLRSGAWFENSARTGSASGTHAITTVRIFREIRASPDRISGYTKIRTKLRVL
eukprot:2880454-Prymnesium_polylepis.1